MIKKIYQRDPVLYGFLIDKPLKLYKITCFLKTSNNNGITPIYQLAAEISPIEIKKKPQNFS